MIGNDLPKVWQVMVGKSTMTPRDKNVKAAGRLIDAVILRGGDDSNVQAATSPKDESSESDRDG